MLDLLPPCSAANLDFDFNFPKGASVGCCWLWALLVEESPCWKLSNSSFLFGLLLPAFSGMTRLLPSTPKAPRYTIHCTCWLCLYMKKLSSTCREGISCVPFPPTCYFAFRGSNLRGKIKKKKRQHHFPLCSIFSEGSFKSHSCCQLSRVLRAPGAEVSPAIFSQGLVWGRSECAVGFSSWLCEANPLCPSAVSSQWFSISSLRRAEKCSN